MRENNWEYAKDTSAGSGNWYADDRGEAYLSWWEAGIGVMQDGSINELWRQMQDLPARKPAHIAMELGVRYAPGGG
jgi:acetylornithine/succinyldiaminopimelate/putrescine aminotransferase